MVNSVEPSGKVPATQGSLDIQARYSDEGVGVDPGSIRLYLYGHDLNARAQTGAAGFHLDIPGPARGRRHLRPELADKLGNKAERDWAFVYGKAATGGVGALAQFMVVDYQPVSKMLVKNTAGKKRSTSTPTA